MQKSLEELTQKELDELFESIKIAVKEEIPNARLESADKYHSFIYVNKGNGTPLGIIELENNLIYTNNRENKEKISCIARNFQKKFKESWSYQYKDRHQ